MKLVITGASGFLGTEVLCQLSDLPSMTIYAFEGKRNVSIHAGNIITLDCNEAKKFDYSDIDVLLNCAFPRDVDDASFAAGLDFIQSVLSKAAADQVRSVINISSQSVYSQKRQNPADETSPIVLETKYAVGKYMTELLVNSLFKDIRHTNLRMASLIGAGFDQRITNKFAAKVIAGEQITITGGKQIFGFMDIRDAASGIIRLICGEENNWQEVYNFGTNRSYTLLEIAQRVVHVGTELGYHASRLNLNKNDIWQNSSMVCNRFYNYFGWDPSFDLDRSINDIYVSIKNRLFRHESWH